MKVRWTNLNHIYWKTMHRLKPEECLNKRCCYNEANILLGVCCTKPAHTFITSALPQDSRRKWFSCKQLCWFCGWSAGKKTSILFSRWWSFIMATSANDRINHKWLCVIEWLRSDDCWWGTTRKSKGESDFSLIPVLTLYGVAAILTFTYGGELLYLQIWCDHSSQPVHIIVTVGFTTR